MPNVEDDVRSNDRESKLNALTELGLRPVSQVFNQIRYWSALDDPAEEKWDYISHYTRTERRELGLGGGGNSRPLIAGLLLVLLLVGVGAGGWLAWPYLSEKFSSLTGETREMEVITGYMMHLGARDLGVIEDKEAMESFVRDWLAQKNASAQEGITYTLAQEITYDEILIDAPYRATQQEAQNAFVRHAALELEGGAS